MVYNLFYEDSNGDWDKDNVSELERWALVALPEDQTEFSYQHPRWAAHNFL